MSAQLRLTPENLSNYLIRQGLLAEGETVRVEVPGAGNINWVRRAVAPDGRSWVVKQARPALEQFPEYEAPVERAAIEARYTEVAGAVCEPSLCARILHFDAENAVLLLEDLGAAESLNGPLARGKNVSEAAAALGAFLGSLHRATRGGRLAGDPSRDLCAEFENGTMQRLHGAHIFELPYRPNDFPLSPAVAARAAEIQADTPLVATVDAAYERYLESRFCLVHADVQPGNILLAPSGPKLLDAEIAHVGDPAFDAGILVAHLLLTGVARGDPGPGRMAAATAWAAYCEAHGGSDRTSFTIVSQYAGIELLRRTIGAARVAAVEDDEAAGRVIDAGLRWVSTPPKSPFEL